MRALLTPSLAHFVDSVWATYATWTNGSPLASLLSDFSGDVVQAMQALKQGDPDRSTVLLESLNALSAAFGSCKAYCGTNTLSYPFARAERQVADTLALFFSDAAKSVLTDAYIDVTISPKEPVEIFALGGKQLPRLFNGLWQLSSTAFGVGTAKGQLDALTRLVKMGFMAADMADHYVSL